MQEVTDSDLAILSAQGDREAFTKLICRHRGSIVALIRRLVADRDESEDLLQETIVQCWLSIAKVRDPERVHAWLLQVARNRCRDWHKSADRRHYPTAQEEMETCLNRYGRAAVRRPDDDIEEAVSVLTASERVAVELFYLQGLSIREVSEVTNAPVGTVKNRLFTARHHLRSFLEADEEKGR